MKKDDLNFAINLETISTDLEERRGTDAHGIFNSPNRQLTLQVRAVRDAFSVAGEGIGPWGQ